MTREEKTNLLNELLKYEENNDIGNLTRTERREFQQWISKALEQEPCEDKEYKKDLNKLKAQILEEGDTVVSKQDLFDRFVEVDNEYKNSHWNLLQILTNINILIGEEPCEDCISRQAVRDVIFAECSGAKLDIDFAKVLLLQRAIKALPPVTPQQKIGWWIRVNKDKLKCSECEVVHFIAQYPRATINYCPNCGAKMEVEE